MRPRSLTAALEEVVVVDAAVGSDAVCQQRGRKAREGLDLVRDRARQRHEDIGGDVPAGARARVDGHRFGAVHDAALGRDDRERAVGAGVGGHARGQNALERVRGVGGGVAEGAVRPTSQGLRRRAREVDGDRVAAHDDLDGQALRRPHAVAPDLARVHTVGHPANGLAHRGLGPVLDHGGQRLEVLEAVFRHEVEQATGSGRVGRHHGVDVADHLLALPDVLGEQGHEVLVQDARPVKLHRWDLKAFLVDLARVEAIFGAADVGDVTDGADDGHDGPVAEDRRDDRHVEQVAGADPRVIGRQDVAGLERLHREPGQDRLDRQWQRQVEDGHRAGRVGQ